MTFDGPHGLVTVPATDVTKPPATVSASAAWKAIFDPTTTQVEPFTFVDYSALPVHSFPVNQIAGFVSSIYGTIGTLSPTDPILLTSTVEPGDNDNGYFAASNPTAEQIYQELIGLAPARGEGNATNGAGPEPDVLPAPASAFAQLRYFHAPLPDLSFALPETPTLDFHQALTGLNNYPAVLRLFHLVFDLKVTLPPGLPDGNTTVLVTPTWSSALGSSNTDVSPWTAATLAPTSFRPTPQGPDYLNGMLGLNDASRFSVTDLDTDLAADRLDSLSVALQTGQRAQLGGDLLQLSRVRVGHDGAHRPRPAIGRPTGHLDRLRHGGRRRLRRSPRRAEDAGDQPDHLARLADHRQSAGHLCRTAHPGQPLRRLHGLGGRAHLEEPVRPPRPVHLRAVPVRSHGSRPR